MQRKKIDSATEQKIITAMVVSKEFLQRVSGFINVDHIEAKHLQRIAKWCLKYFEKYDDAPKENIENLYNAWSAKGKAQEEVVDAVHDVLESLSENYDEGDNFNVPYLVDIAIAYFNTARIAHLRDELDYSLTSDDENAVTDLLARFSTISKTIDTGINPLNDEGAWDEAFSDSQKPLITWGCKDADRFFGNALCRDGLIAILAPEKRGKTQWCVEFAMRTLMNRKKVALFEVGDMSQSQILKRLAMRLMNRPLYRNNLGKIKIPKRIEVMDDVVNVKNRTIECTKVVNAKGSKKAVEKFLRANGLKPDEDHFMISIQPNSAVNVKDICGILDQWEINRGFVPDVIIIDYPDILAPEPGTGGMQVRDQVNSTWKALRRLSQEKHCLVIAPTQADANSYGRENLTASNFSEDKRKLAHVTGMLGLNQTSDEKSDNLMRLNWIALRESNFNPKDFLYVGQCYTLGRAFTCSSL